MNSIMGRADSSIPNILEGSIEPLSSKRITQQLPVSSVQPHLEDRSSSSAPEGQEILLSCNLKGQYESSPNNANMQQLAVPGREVGQTQVMLPNSAQSKLSMSNKRKATTEFIADNQDPQMSSAPNMRVSQVGPSGKASGMPHLSAPNKKATSNSSKSSANAKKVVQVEPVINNAQKTVSRKGAQPQVSPKTPIESNESVRAKLRESLASALALVSQQQDSSSAGKTKMENVTAGITQKGVTEHEALVSSSSKETAIIEPGKDEKTCTSSVPCPSDGRNDVTSASEVSHSKETDGEAAQTWKFVGPDFQSDPVLSGEDMPFSSGFFFKDELLMGNGLSWASDLNQHIPQVKEAEHTEKPELMDDDMSSHEEGVTIRSPESVAFEIESELFKLFGGVNKKYKEKARSLLFNLRDRNNPELRERVMSGEITPDRLCSMTAEELASKELSQWRIAKAEELAQMKVLPESEAHTRRLVKKTHKGEYQVDFDQDIGASEEISHGTSVPHRNRSKKNDTDAGPPLSAGNTKRERENKCKITIPSDGADLQGLMVDDVRDLPPIVSLDEFMESLDKEPPFENLPVDSGRRNPESDKQNSELGDVPKSPIQPSKHPAKIISKKTEEVGSGTIKQVGDAKSTDSKKGSDSSTAHVVRGERVWEGLVQINISSMASFIALYKSGEKASSREWPSFFEIKGRVKLDAFDKFLQALPMSRSRAIMVSHFVLKEGSTDSESASLFEVVNSYIMDERVGFAEPATGVELYFCPPRTTTVDMIINHLPKTYTMKLNEINSGLIAIVVWRKVIMTSPPISHNSSSFQHNSTTNMQQLPSSGAQNAANLMNRSVGFAPPHNVSDKKPPHVDVVVDDDDDDDDVPPGFGPPGSRDDDDLPEFNFSGSSNPPSSRVSDPNPFPGSGTGSHNLHARPPPRPVEQMRELVQKYGQNVTNVDTGIPMEPWNEDDDDDIPEWEPKAPRRELPPQPPSLPPQPAHNPVLPPHMVNQPPHMVNQPARMMNQPSFHRPPWPPLARPMQPLQPPMRVPQQGTWWHYDPINMGTQHQPVGQLNDASRLVAGHPSRDTSRGF